MPQTFVFEEGLSPCKVPGCGPNHGGILGTEQLAAAWTGHFLAKFLARARLVCRGGVFAFVMFSSKYMYCFSVGGLWSFVLTILPRISCEAVGEEDAAPPSPKAPRLGQRKRAAIAKAKAAAE